MVTLEQVKLLESKVVKAISYVEKVTNENVQLQDKLDSYQKRIADLEILVQRFKEDQGRIEDGILSALDRLNQFEDAIEHSLSDKSKGAAESEVKPAETAAEPEISGQDEEKEEDTLDGEKDEESASGELDIF
jgi:TolA-binding protein